jgi:hypothetical protein
VADNNKQVMTCRLAKAEGMLVEVILATMNGNVYFVDLETVNQRATSSERHAVQRSASLDPRG